MEKRKTEVGEYLCLKCSNKFTIDTYYENTYGIWDLRCDRCGKKALVSTFKDAIWERIHDTLENKYGKITDEEWVRYGLDHPQIIELQKRFEETCDPCPCGGRFKVKGKIRCPSCLSDDVKGLKRIVVDEDTVPDNNIWITHTQWEKEHGK